MPSHKHNNCQELLQSPPSFSIRGHALTFRQKELSHNWPFPIKYLRLCLHRGVRDVLPPFEGRRSLLRNQSRTGISTSSLYNQPQVKEKNNNQKMGKAMKILDNTDGTCDHQETTSFVTEETDDQYRWLEGSRLSTRNRRRVKSIKMRSVDEIYADAKLCTLEDDSE